MGEDDFSKAHTLTAKGGAILLMLFHHLFMYPERIRGSYFNPGLFLGDRSLVSYIAAFANICVGMYIVLSGFGIGRLAKQEGGLPYSKVLARIRQFLFRYWFVFFIFVPAGFLFFGRIFDLKEFLQNLLCLRFSYNKEWWFVSLYIELLLFLPLWRKFLDWGLLPGFVGTTVFLGLGGCGKWAVALLDIKMHGNGIASSVYTETVNFLLWQFVFSIGYLTARYDLFIKTKTFLKRKGCGGRWFFALTAVAVIVFRQFVHGGKQMDLVLAPIFTFAFAEVFVQGAFRRFLMFFGRHSTYLWLIHSFFCYYYFSPAVYLFHDPLLVYPWFLLLTVSSAVLLQKAENCIQKQWQKRRGGILFERETRK